MIHLHIAANELRNVVRARAIRWIGGLLVLLSTFCLMAGLKGFYQVNHHREEARATMRRQFLDQGAINPHGAAHYGHYVFKPHSILNVIDQGVEVFTGVTLRLEGHKQNEVQFAPSQRASSLVRFGELSFTLMLQIVFPVLIIFMAHNTFVDERRNGTLPLLTSQGITIRQLLWGKILAYTALFALLLFLFTTPFMLSVHFSGITHNVPDVLPRTMMLLLLYSVYYFLLIALTVFCSARVATSGNVLIIMLSTWFVFTVIIPKAVANIGEQAFPLPSKLEFNHKIALANQAGINGHDPKDERVERLKDSLLVYYQVDDLAKLPVNADGIIMQADEEYHNRVYDQQFSSLQNTIEAQNSISSLASLLNPYIAVQHLSMGLAQTDVMHHFRFMHQAESYRRFLIKKLNDEFAYGGSKTGDWEWTVKANYWKGIEDFQYDYPTIGWSLSHYRSELLSIIIWLIVGILIIQWAANRVNIV